MRKSCMPSCYQALIASLKENGIASELFRLNNRWIAIKVHCATIGVAHSFWLRKSGRGWLIGDGKIFRIPTEETVCDLCVTLAKGVTSLDRAIELFALEWQPTAMADEFA